MSTNIERRVAIVLSFALACAATCDVSLAADRGGDCNDLNAAVFPGQTEIVGNRFDDDCDGLADEAANGDPSTDTGDIDNDGQSLQSGDCDDTNSIVHLGTAEVPGNAIDDDCDGLADEDAANVPSSDDFDADGDGFALFDRLFRAGFETIVM